MRRVALAERHDWRQQAEDVGFIYHTQPDGSPYWSESVAYEFSLPQIEQHIEQAAADLEALCLEFVASAVEDEAILKSLHIPAFAWDAIRDSWQRGDRNLYGRFDFAYDGRSPPKLLEYNADTPTALFETGYFQWKWLEDQIAAGVLPEGADQFNSVHERLIAAFKELRGGKPYTLHLSCMSQAQDDLGTIGYLADCASQAMISTRTVMIEQIGLNGQGLFVDEGDQPIEVLFKLYPWEWMLQEEFGKAVPRSTTQFVEPIWKTILSTKGLLPHLHARAPGHDNLLPAFFEGDAGAAALGTDYIRKPLHSREGANLKLMRAGTTVETGGPYNSGPAILQAAADMPVFDGCYPVIGAWMVASEPAGMLVREADGPITTDTARFVPHFIVP
jgi:glutathionylspermidine synthase